jgi:hypothetical protein
VNPSLCADTIVDAARADHADKIPPISTKCWQRIPRAKPFGGRSTGLSVRIQGKPTNQIPITTNGPPSPTPRFPASPKPGNDPRHTNVRAWRPRNLHQSGSWCGSNQCPPRTQKGDPKVALCRCKLITHLKEAIELEAQTRSGRVTNAVAPDIDTQVAQTIA